MSQTLNMELQGDGLIETLYHYLWSKDSLFNQSPQVNIPDTVVYRYEQPAFWYFTSKAKPQTKSLVPQPGTEPHEMIMDLGEQQATKIMRKARKNLNSREIERVFLKNSSPSGIIAVYMYKKSERNIINIMRMQEKT